MKKNDFLLIYEHKNRELDNLCLLRAELECRGYNVDILCRFDVLKQLKTLIAPKPKVVGCVAAYRTVSNFVQVYRFTGKVKKIINFRWEQVFADVHVEKFIPSGEARDVAHLCWGQSAYNQLKSAGISKLAITGPLQMDFLIPPMNSIYLSQDDIKAKYGIPKEGKVLLYISSFAYATMTDTELEYNEKWLGQSLDEAVKSEKKSFDYTINCLKKLTEDDPTMYVIYRPHPAENSEVIKGLDTPERFIINSDYSVKQWIFAADYIVTWISTSLCEVYYAHKKAVILRPYPVNPISDPVVYKNCRSVSSYEELKHELFSDVPFPLDEKLINDYYNVIEDKPAYIRTADFFVEVLNNDAYNINDKRRYVYRIIKNALCDICILFMSKNKYLAKLVNYWPFNTMKTAFNEHMHFSPTNIVSDKEIENRVCEFKNIIKAN